MRHYLIFGGALVAQKRLLHHHRAPTHGVVAQRTAITPIGDGALMAQWRTAGSPILLPHATCGKEPLRKICL
jgi:hypothetical protein